VAFQRQHCLQSKFFSFHLLLQLLAFSKYYNFSSFSQSFAHVSGKIYILKRTAKRGCRENEEKKIGKILKMPFKCYADGASIY
jgi:hypothetical protein